MLNYILSQLQKPRQLVPFFVLVLLVTIGNVVSLFWLIANAFESFGGVGPGAEVLVIHLLIKMGLSEQCSGILLNWAFPLYMLLLVVLAITLLISVIGKRASWLVFVSESLTGLTAMFFNFFSINQVFLLGAVMFGFGVLTLCAMYKAGQNGESAEYWFYRLNSPRAAQIGTDNAIYPLLFFMLMLLLLLPGGTSLVGNVSETFLALLLVSQPIKLWESVTADDSDSQALEDARHRISDLQKSNERLEQNLRHLEVRMNSLDEASCRIGNEIARSDARTADVRGESSARRTFLSDLLSLLGFH